MARGCPTSRTYPTGHLISICSRCYGREDLLPYPMPLEACKRGCEACMRAGQQYADDLVSHQRSVYEYTVHRFALWADRSNDLGNQKNPRGL